MPLWLVWVPAWKKRVYYPDLWVLCCDFMWPDSEWDSRVLGESCGPGFSSWAALSWARANAAFSASSCEQPSTWIRPCSHFWKEKKNEILAAVLSFSCDFERNSKSVSVLTSEGAKSSWSSYLTHWNISQRNCILLSGAFPFLLALAHTPLHFKRLQAH